ncbi:hypothetical protein, partial [Massilia alkalitolerans]
LITNSVSSAFTRFAQQSPVASTPGPVAAAQQGVDHASVDITDKSSSWGALVKQSASGRSSTYARHNQDGSVTLTHVYWTLEAAASCASCDHRRQYRDHE